MIRVFRGFNCCLQVQRLMGFCADELRALPWAGMVDALGVSAFALVQLLLLGVETLGYCRMSLRDNDLALFCGASLARF